MAKQTINIGSTPNKGDGDPLRTAFTKINSNFTELYDRDLNTDAQTLALVGNTLSISNGNSVDLSAYLDAENLTGVLPALDGSNLTNINFTPESNLEAGTLKLDPGGAARSVLLVNDTGDDNAASAKIVFQTLASGFYNYDLTEYSKGIVVDTTTDGYTVVSGGNSGSSTITNFTFDNRVHANGTEAERKGTLRFNSGIDNGPSLSTSVSMQYLPTTTAESTGQYFSWDTDGMRFLDGTVQTTAYPGPQTTLDGDVTGSVFADDSTLLVDGVNGKLVGDYENGTSTIGSTRVESYDIKAFQDTNTSDLYVSNSIYGGETGTIKNVAIGSTPPANSTGADGDRAGMIAFDSTYIYYCTANYTDGVADIWKRVAWAGDTW